MRIAKTVRQWTVSQVSTERRISVNSDGSHFSSLFEFSRCRRKAESLRSFIFTRNLGIHIRILDVCFFSMSSVIKKTAFLVTTVAGGNVKKKNSGRVYQSRSVIVR
jgi:hypothetical protein